MIRFQESCAVRWEGSEPSAFRDDDGRQRDANRPQLHATHAAQMKRAPSLESFLRDPVGKWIQSGPSLTWCSSRSVAGSTLWGAPDADATREILRAFHAVWAPSMSERVDILFDARRVEHVDPISLGVVFAWNLERRDAIARRVRTQVSIVRPGPIGIMLSGILPMLGDTHPFRVVHDAKEGFRRLSPAEGDALLSEVEAHVEEVLCVRSELRALRAHLRDSLVAATLATTARAIGTSSRSLQRLLAAEGTTFQAELQSARFARACELLRTTDRKVAAIAADVGLSERGLSGLFAARTGSTPARHRGSAESGTRLGARAT